MTDFNILVDFATVANPEKNIIVFQNQTSHPSSQYSIPPTLPYRFLRTHGMTPCVSCLTVVTRTALVKSDGETDTDDEGKKEQT